MQTGLPTADTSYYNGKVVSLWDSHPICEAVAIRGNRFLVVGSNAEVLKLAGPETKKIDLKGRTVLPGLIDSHTHPISAALSEMDESLPPFNSIADIQSYVRRRAAKGQNKDVILVPKVYAPRLREHRYPTRLELDEAASDRPVLADKLCGCGQFVPSRQRLKITRDTPQPKTARSSWTVKASLRDWILATQPFAEFR